MDKIVIKFWSAKITFFASLFRQFKNKQKNGEISDGSPMTSTMVLVSLRAAVG